MTAAQYCDAREALGWTHERLARVIGKTERQSFRYANGDMGVPDTVAKLVRRLVSDSLTMSTHQFEQSVAEL